MSQIKSQLPEPTKTELARSKLLLNLILEQINNNNNWLSFNEFMHMVLYHPEYGYYQTSARIPIGEHFDFITAPELGNLFAYGLAKQIVNILKENPNFSILELGAGTGSLTINLLIELNKLGILPQKYYILDISKSLVIAQKKLITNLTNDLAFIKDRVVWLDHLPTDDSFSGIVIANEVIDALPVNLFHYDNYQFYEYGISNKNNLLELTKALPNNNLLSYLENNVLHYIKNSTSYTSEVNLLIDDWLTSIASCLLNGIIIIIDYGFKSSEYFHPDRSMGTLMCHYRHFAHHDFLWHPGLSDLTCHVDFSHVAEIALRSGLDVLAYTNQANFLIANNVTDYFATMDEIIDETNNKNIFKIIAKKKELLKLTSPNAMGELFKVIILGKDLSPHYFSDLRMYDKSYEL